MAHNLLNTVVFLSTVWSEHTATIGWQICGVPLKTMLSKHSATVILQIRCVSLQAMWSEHAATIWAKLWRIFCQWWGSSSKARYSVIGAIEASNLVSTISSNSSRLWRLNYIRTQHSQVDILNYAFFITLFYPDSITFIKLFQLI